MNAARRKYFSRHETGHPVSDIHSRMQPSAEPTAEAAKRMSVSIVYSLENIHEALQAELTIYERGCVLAFYQHGITRRMPISGLKSELVDKELLLGHEVITSQEDDLGNKYSISITIYRTPMQANLKLNRLLNEEIHQR